MGASFYIPGQRSSLTEYVDSLIRAFKRGWFTRSFCKKRLGRFEAQIKLFIDLYCIVCRANFRASGVHVSVAIQGF